MQRHKEKEKVRKKEGLESMREEATTAAIHGGFTQQMREGNRFHTDTHTATERGSRVPKEDGNTGTEKGLMIQKHTGWRFPG